MKQLWNFAAQRKLEIYASYIESKKNKIADFESKNVKHNLEWALKDHIFNKLKIKLGQPTIDLFTSRGNNKVKRFYSFYPDPLASGVDAFSFDWSQDIIYAFPPFNLIPFALQTIGNDTLIVSIFVNQSWFTRLFTLLIKEPLWLSSSDISLSFPYRRKSIPYLPNTRLIACYMSGDACKSRIFPRKIADTIFQSWRPGTSRKYDIYISKWMQFCSERNFSPYETTINQVLLFLYDLFQSDVGYNVMNTARSSLSTFINIDSVQVGQHPAIIYFSQIYERSFQHQTSSHKIQIYMGCWNCYYVHFQNRY